LEWKIWREEAGEERGALGECLVGNKVDGRKGRPGNLKMMQSETAALVEADSTEKGRGRKEPGRNLGKGEALILNPSGTTPERWGLLRAPLRERGKKGRDSLSGEAAVATLRSENRVLIFKEGSSFRKTLRKGGAPEGAGQGKVKKKLP